MTQTTDRYSLDELRWFAADLAASAGLPPERAASLARLLLWHDTAGFPSLGLAALPEWLNRLERKEIDPKTLGRIVSEHPATADLDASCGMPPLVLARASEIASQKAREIGVGLVRIKNLGPQPFALQVAAELAIGPQSALVLGPNGAWAFAVPSAEGLPLVLGSTLGTDAKGFPPLPETLATLMVPCDEWTVQAVSIPSFEPIHALHDRVTRWLAQADSVPRLDPTKWDAHRASVRDQGLALDPSAWNALSQRAKLAGLTPPSPLGHTRPV